VKGTSRNSNKDYSEIVFKGILIGFGVFAPINPVGILCINKFSGIIIILFGILLIKKSII